MFFPPPRAQSLHFGDRVRIKSTRLTDSTGLSRRIGCIYGRAIPSASGIAVIGATDDDYALNVRFDDGAGSHWFSLELLEPA